MPPSTETAAQSGVESARKAVEGCHIDDDDQPKAPRCVGRCDIALGDVTQHNIMVRTAKGSGKFGTVSREIGGEPSDNSVFECALSVTFSFREISGKRGK